MSRSSKKGPFVEERLLAADREAERLPAASRSSRPGRAPRPSFRRWSGTRSPSTTDVSTYRCSSMRPWSGTSWASLPSRVPSAVTPATGRRRSRGAETGEMAKTQTRRFPKCGPRRSGFAARRARRGSCWTRFAVAACPRREPSSPSRLETLHATSTRCCARPSPTPRPITAYNGDDMVISACYADEGPGLKRWKPRARGRADRIVKGTCHITIRLAPLAEQTTTASSRPAAVTGTPGAGEAGGEQARVRTAGGGGDRDASGGSGTTTIARPR